MTTRNCPAVYTAGMLAGLVLAGAADSLIIALIESVPPHRLEEAMIELEGSPAPFYYFDSLRAAMQLKADGDIATFRARMILGMRTVAGRVPAAGEVDRGA